MKIIVQTGIQVFLLVVIFLSLLLQPKVVVTSSISRGASTAVDGDGGSSSSRMEELYYEDDNADDGEDDTETEAEEEEDYAAEYDDYYYYDEEQEDEEQDGDNVLLHNAGASGVVVDNDHGEAVAESSDDDDDAAAAAAVLEEQSRSKNTKKKKTLPDCGVYYAESTIPGAGFGIFAGRDFKYGEDVTPGDLVVPTIDIPWHLGYTDDYEFPFLWNEYNWDTTGFPFMDEEGQSVSSSSFGIGALPNCFFPLINVGDTHTLCDAAGLHRSRDAGSGAFTPYYNRRGQALVDIPAGMEIFVDYGESYFDTRTEQFGPVPLPHHYRMSNKFLHRYADFKDYLLARRHDICQQQGFCPRLDLHRSMYSVIHEFKEIWESRVLHALPTDPSRLEQALEKGTDSTFYNRSIRDLEWLDEHGTCMDNLYADLSSIRQAGRGAFARQSIKKGDIITPGPLIHVSSKDMFIMYEATIGGYRHGKNNIRNKDAPIHQQLLLNYCFGHVDSSILLCPYGITSNLINHSRERANAKVVWSTKSMRKPEWLEQPPSQWAESMVAGLAFDFVATKDIAAGDEVFISYGDDWEKAWNDHVKRFSKAPGRSPYYFPAFELDEQVDSIVKTVAEGSYGSKEVQLKCHEAYRLLRGLWPDNIWTHPCRAVHRYLVSTENGGEEEYRYWVEILEREDEENDSRGQCYEHMAEIMFDVPRDAFTFSDSLGSRDHWQPWSFRHHIGIPDDIMPAAWLDRKQSA